MKTTNEKKIVKDVVNKRHPHLVAVEDDIVDIVRVTFSEIGNTVKEGGKVLVKNFGTFELKQRKPRPRYDTGRKAVVTTDPKDICQFTQSPNIFRDGKTD